MPSQSLSLLKLVHLNPTTQSTLILLIRVSAQIVPAKSASYVTHIGAAVRYLSQEASAACRASATMAIVRLPDSPPWLLAAGPSDFAVRTLNYRGISLALSLNFFFTLSPPLLFPLLSLSVCVPLFRKPRTKPVFCLDSNFKKSWELGVPSADPKRNRRPQKI